MAGRPAGKTNVAGRIRSAFILACDKENGGIDLHAKMKESLERDFLGTLKALKGFVPTEMLLMPDDEGNKDIDTVFELKVVRAPQQPPAIEGEVVSITSKEPDHGPIPTITERSG